MRKLFSETARFCHRRHRLVLAVAAAVTLVAGLLASRLEIALTWLDMVPADDPSVHEFDVIIAEFGSATDVVLAVENPDPVRLKEVASEVAAHLAGMAEYFSRVEYRRDRAFVLAHGLMLETSDDLEESRAIFADLDLVPFLEAVNGGFERSYIGGEDSLEDDELQLVSNVNGMVDIVTGLAGAVDSADRSRAAATVAERYVDDMLVPYSADRRMVLITLRPKVSINDIAGIGVVVPALRAELGRLASRYPDTRFALTGMHVIAQDEMETAGEDSFVLTAVAFVVILVAFVVAFRMGAAPMLAMITLLLGITWDLGLASLIVGRLNLMTVMMAVILLGLGVDYFIHILSGYCEGLDTGISAEEAAAYALDKVGTGVFIGALTTAVAFAVLTLVRMQVFRELGVILSLGIVTTMLVSFTVLPAMLAVTLPGRGTRAGRVLWGVLAMVTVVPAIMVGIERLARMVMRGPAGGRSSLFGRLGSLVDRRPAAVLAAVLATVAAAAAFVPRVWFDQNLMNMEMKGLESVELQREIIRRYGLSDSAVVFTAAGVEETQRLHAELDRSPLVGSIDSIASYLPSDADQAERLPHLAAISAALAAYKPGSGVDPRALEAQVERLRLNLLEISELATIGGQRLLEERLEALLAEGSVRDAARRLGSADPDVLAAVQAGFGARLGGLVAGMATPARISPADLPAAVLDRYRSRDGALYLTAVYARSDLFDRVSDSPFLAFVRRLAPKTTGMPVFMKVLIDDSARYGRSAMLIALAAIVVLISVDLRSPTLVLLGLAPLVLGSVLMLGIMGLAGVPLNIMSATMLPLIIGIGIDDGVHLLHRYRIEGPDFPAILGSVGKALFLTTFTTMIAFGSLAFAKMQAYVSVGVLLFVGMGSIYLVTVTFIPATLRLLARRKP